MQEVQATLPMGSILRDRYMVEGLLGKGGFGAVYLVKDLRVKGNLFALKEMIDSSKQERARFAFEGEVLKRLDHQALPRVYRVFDDDKNNRAYMLMDYIEGPNLETLRQQQPDKRFSLPQVLSMMAPVIQAVSYLHHQTPPIIHRDIKPANIIVPDAGDSAMLVDFGIAKEFDPDSTTTAVRRCSPGYGAPEQYSRGTNTRTDIYGLGATFFALLTGSVPEDAFYRMTQMGSQHIDPLDPVNNLVPAIPPPVAEAIQKAMAISINDRYASVEEFWQALHASASSEKTPAPLALPVTPLPAASDPRQIADVNTEARPLALSSTGEGERSRRRGFPWPILLGVVALALVLGLAAAAYLPSLAPHQGASAPHATPVVHHPPVTATARPTQVPSPTAKATQAPKPTQTTAPPVASAYPQVAGTHTGAARNTTTTPPTVANMRLSLQQSQGTISGNVTIDMPLQGSGTIYNGFVQTNNYIQFSVTGFAGHAPLRFSGTVSSNGSMSGSYCSIDSAGRCNNSVGGYGSWNVGPSSSSASGSSYTSPGWQGVYPVTIVRRSSTLFSTQ